MALKGPSYSVDSSFSASHDAKRIPGSSQIFPSIVELNVGGVFYATALSTLIKDGNSLLGQMFLGKEEIPLLRDSKGKYFLDRDGVLFRYVLDYLRNEKLVLPENFSEKERLLSEAKYYKITGMIESLTRVSETSSHASEAPHEGCIVVGYRGTFTFGRDGLSDAKFRKVNRILICGRITNCREVFGNTLNESRDPDRGAVDRYTSRFFLTHSNIEQAFDMLLQAGYTLRGACGTGTAGGFAVEKRPGIDVEEERWNHYNEFVWTKQ